MCNVIRERQHVLGPGTDFMRKRTGTGGAGGRRLHADLQLGSVGFKKQYNQRQQKPAMNWSQFNLAGVPAKKDQKEENEDLAGFKIKPMISQNSQTRESQGEERYKSISLKKEVTPEFLDPVSLGDLGVGLGTGRSSISGGGQRPRSIKKQVVLRKHKDASACASFIKSLQTLPNFNKTDSVTYKSS